MAALTLAEAKKLALNQGDTKRAGLISIFAESSDLLAAMPYTDIVGTTLTYNKEGALPGVAFRGVNETYSASVGVINPEHEALKIVGGEISLDRFIDKTTPGARTRHEILKAKAMAHKLSYTFIKGDSATSVREFDGLEKRLVGDNVLSNNTGSGGGGLSISKLDELCDSVEGITHLLMLKKTRRRLTEFLRTSVSIQTSRDEFGRQVFSYNGIPILLADGFGDTANVTAVEAFTGGGTDLGTSIYGLHLEDGWLGAIQNGIMSTEDLGVLQAAPAVGTRIEWYVSMVLYHPRGAMRLRDIALATVAVA